MNIEHEVAALKYRTERFEQLVKKRIFELTGMSVLAQTRANAISELLETLLEVSEFELQPNQSFQESLGHLEREHLDRVLASYADVSARQATALRKWIYEARGWKES